MRRRGADTGIVGDDFGPKAGGAVVVGRKAIPGKVDIDFDGIGAIEEKRQKGSFGECFIVRVVGILAESGDGAVDAHHVVSGDRNAGEAFGRGGSVKIG